MAKYLFSLFFVVMLVACSVSNVSKADRQQRAALKAEMIAQRLDRRAFVVDINNVYPQRMSPRFLDSGYSFGISGDSVCSHLPYFGRAYSLPYGGGVGLNFSAVADDYSSRRLKDNCTRIIIKVRSEDDNYKYVLDVFDDGRASLIVSSREREPISFSGNVRLDVK